MSEEEALPQPHRELADVTFRSLLIAAVGLAVALAAMAGLVLWLFPLSTRDQRMALPLPRAAAPALQSSPRAAMTAFRDEQLRSLNSIGWVDQAHGIAHVPIADAMADVVRDGIPGWPTPTVKP